MVQTIVRSIASVVVFAVVTLSNSVAMAGPEAVAGPGGHRSARLAQNNKESVGRFIKPFKGAAALVFKDGAVIPVDQDGRVIPACEICTPRLEAQWGPRCVKARQASKAYKRSTAAAVPPLICDKLVSTDVKAVSPISVLRHTGSTCITFFVPSDGQPKAYQYCW